VHKQLQSLIPWLGKTKTECNNAKQEFAQTEQTEQTEEMLWRGHTDGI
jgi:hypothetical protein